LPAGEYDYSIKGTGEFLLSYIEKML